MSTAAANVVCHQPSWSDKPLYWAFDYETFVKLKKLHKWYYQNLQLMGRYNRWIRKEPQNRKGPMPEFFKKDLYEFVNLYHLVRKPYENEKEASDIWHKCRSLHQQVNEMYEEASQFFEN